MKIFRLLLFILLLINAKCLFAVSFTDTVLSNKNFNKQTSYNKAKMLNQEATARLERLNVDVLSYLECATSIAKQNNFKDLLFDSYMNYGLFWKYGREYKLASDNYYLANSLINDDESKRIKVFLALGENYRASNDYTDAISVLNTALDLIKNKSEYSLEKAKVYNRLAAAIFEIYFSPTNAESTETLKKAIRYADSSTAFNYKNNFDLIINNYCVIGAAYRELHKFDVSINLLNKAIRIMETYPDSSFSIYNYNNVVLNLAGYYLKIKDYDNAEKFALKAIEYTKAKNITVKDGFAYIILSDVYAFKQNYEKAYYYEKLESTFFVNEKYNIQHAAMIAIEAKYHSNYKEEKLKQSEEVREYQIWLFGLVLAIMVMIIFVIRSRNKTLSRAHDLVNEQNQELQELNATKDKFFSIIAHDLKNPIFSMQAMIEFIAIDLENNEFDDLKTNFELLKKNSKNVGELLENLLTWSQSQRGIIQYFPVKLNSKTIINNCVEISSLQTKVKGIHIHDLSYSNYEIFADANMLITVIRNLLSNASKFTDKNGDIYINAIETNSRNFVEFSIKDTGIGIPEDKIDNLFSIDKSYQRAGTNHELGTGLGLILCKEFIEKNGGSIRVESEVGVGSTFHFTIPIYVDKPMNPAAEVIEEEKHI